MKEPGVCFTRLCTYVTIPYSDNLIYFTSRAIFMVFPFMDVVIFVLPAFLA